MTQPFTDALTWVPKSRALAATFARAGDLARAQSHATVSLEHLLLALIEDTDASAVLLACNVDLLKLNDAVSAHLKQQPAAAAVMPDAAPEVVAILEYAVAAAQQSKRNEVNGAIVLAAVVGEGNSVAAHLLQALGLTFEGAVQALRKAVAPPPRPTASAAPPPSPPAAVAPPPADDDPITTARRRIEAMRSGSPAPAPAPTPAAPPASAVAMDAADQPDNPTAGDRTASPPPVPEPPRETAPQSESRDWTPPPLPPATPPRPARMPPPVPPISTPPARIGPSGSGAQIAVPWTDPSTAVAAEPQTATVIPFPSVRTGTPIDPARLLDRLTRRMKLNVASTIEIRIPRAAVQATAAAAGAAPDSAATRALTVRLKAPAGGLTIENAAPETQWFDARIGAQEDEVRWRWIVTPNVNGSQVLQLAIGMRTIAIDGVTIETTLPEHQAEVWVTRPLRPLLITSAIAIAAATCGALAMLVSIKGIGPLMRLFG